ncbi:hypothetical protein PRK78_005875 [Emydomyces testavorans]|uniref:Homologous-pairing protein 2 winged helix domain-containing protein n=1 Tax=Emydomyces testavorans TaxID=2070801 RepID=A0AAF0DKF7_9EURO|nr:hypothetical protein PRK78_005875 [Emydomyces testavorans]
MAPRKEKGDKGSVEDGQQKIGLVLNKMQSSVFAYAAKALKDMHEKKQIEGRVSGKQVVYHAIQDPADEVTAEQLATIDQEIEDMRNQVTSAKSREKLLRAELATLNARVSSSELREQVTAFEKEKGRLLARVAPLKDSAADTRTVSAEEKAGVEKERRTWQKHVAVRKKICQEMWMRCVEVLPEAVQGNEELWEALGLEGSL